MNEDLEFLWKSLEDANLIPIEWEGEDKNITAFTSKEKLVTWYSQPPGIDGESYRDRGFYCRELAHISRILQPRSIVEFGTCQGIGTCLLHWLNPLALLTTVDINNFTYLPGDIKVSTGYLAKRQGIPCEYINSNSWEYTATNVELCFIDADHSYEAMKHDSETAWRNRNPEKWAIVWHDYNKRHPGVMQAVWEFHQEKREPILSRPDSDTVWAWSL